MVYDGETEAACEIDSTEGAEVVFIERSDGSHALQVTYLSAMLHKNISFAPNETPAIPSTSSTPVAPSWDWQTEDIPCLAVDVENISSESVQLYIVVLDANGQALTAHANIGGQDGATVFMGLADASGGAEPGLKGVPHLLPPDLNPIVAGAESFRYAWGERALDVSRITMVKFYIKGNLTDRTLIFDNLRVVNAPDGVIAPLEDLVDAFGQYTGADWPGRVTTDAQLRQQAQAERAALDAALSTSDFSRSRFGGWADGPRLEATGYFRTAQHDGKWTLVDPEGYLFFANGIANCRLSNTYTITGRDFKSPDARSGPLVASELRRNMFTWLPEDDDPLAVHFNYAQGIHTGAIEQGETFSFYAANLQRRYGRDGSAPEGDDPTGINAWRETTLDRMSAWGFTCLGNWIDPGFYHNGRMPYFAHAWIDGDHSRLDGANAYWQPIHDPFDPTFVEAVRRAVEGVAADVADDPWCVGVFLDNELSWGNPWSDAGRFGLVMNALERTDADCPAKAVFTRRLQEQYDTIAALNVAWGTDLSSWESFSAGFELPGTISEPLREDLIVLSESIADQYFRTVRETLKAALPNHLYLGARFADWGMTAEAVNGAVRYTDVTSFNMYTEGMPGHLAETLERIDHPSLIGEFHFGALDRGMFHGGIVTASDQTDRGRMYTAYLESVLDNPYLIGAHWFQYADSPTTGRAIDGENYNSGFVSTTDHPYPEMVEAARAVNEGLYVRRFRGVGD